MGNATKTIIKPKSSSKNIFNKSFLSILAVLAVGCLAWNLPIPTGLTESGWHILIIFTLTIATIIAKPLPMGAVAMIALTFSIMTNTITLKDAFEGFSQSVVWFVVVALFIAEGFKVTGLGRRIGLFFTALLGKKTLGLSYGLLATDFILSPLIPSVTGRVAGIVFPIMQGIAESFGSLPNSPSSKRMGAFLTLTAFQGTVITSAMFMTAMAANPMLVAFSTKQGLNITWGSWALAAIVPGLLSLILMPLIVYAIYPPEVKSTPNASSFAKKQLKDMGRIKGSEWIMLGTLCLLLVLWIFGKTLNMDAALAALLGLCILLITQVVSWDSLLKITIAWETFIWFSILLLFAAEMSNTGVIEWFVKSIETFFVGYDWKISFPLLVLLYFYTHYFFASSTAHVAAFYLPFLVLAIGLGTPAYLAMFVFIFTSSLFGGLTHYSLSPAPLLFGVGYVPIKTWWIVGFVVSTVNLLIWCTVGPLWWKLLGLM